VKVQNLDKVIRIEVGGNHNLALKKDGSLWAWGNIIFKYIPFRMQ